MHTREPAGRALLEGIDLSKVDTRGNWHRKFHVCIIRVGEKLPEALDSGVRMVGPILVSVAWSLFAGVTYAYFFHMVPMREWSLFAYPGNLVTLVGLFILFNLIYNHTKAVTTPSFYNPRPEDIPANIDEILKQEYLARQQSKASGFSQHCGMCRAPKPPRTHHCHACNRCVLKMDHHCPWIANCVGYNNLRFFYLFMVWLMIGCMFCVFVCVPPVVWRPRQELYRAHYGVVFFILVLTSSAFIALSVMVGLHTYLLISNQTTIEMYYNRSQSRAAQRRGEHYVNPYDLGSARNWQSVFGKPRFFLSWLLPGPGPEGDGLTYSTIADRDATLVSLRVEGVNGKHDSATSIVVKRNATVGSDLSTELVLSDATNGVGVGGTGYVSLPTLESGAASLRTPNHASLVAPPPSVPPPQLGYSEGRKDA